MSHDTVKRLRAQKDNFLKRHASSPLTEAQKAAFNGLRYYPYNPDLDFTVIVNRHAEDDIAQVFTTKNTIRNYQRYGNFAVTIDGQQVMLTLYRTPHGFFLPFVDAGAGEETYPAGRYLDVEKIKDDTFHVDFNQAYNPFCAYNDNYDCPITPPENRLNVAVRAGEMLPEGEWLHQA